MAIATSIYTQYIYWFAIANLLKKRNLLILHFEVRNVGLIVVLPLPVWRPSIRRDLLRQLYGKIIIPEAVYRELTEVKSPVPGTIEVQTYDWIEVRPISDPNQLLGGTLNLGKSRYVIQLLLSLQR